jgi:hypothetical protein
MSKANVHILSIGTAHFGFPTAEDAAKAFTLLSNATRYRQQWNNHKYVYEEEPMDERTFHNQLTLSRTVTSEVIRAKTTAAKKTTA